MKLPGLSALFLAADVSAASRSKVVLGLGSSGEVKGVLFSGLGGVIGQGSCLGFVFGVVLRFGIGFVWVGC